MRRRDFLRNTGAAGLTLALREPSTSATTKKPNVLFIAMDDLNDWTSLHGGHPQARTPNLERLAKRGVFFSNAYCAAPACNPSRAALMTGRAPYETGMYSNMQIWREVLPDDVTLPQYFTKHGYFSAGAGKIYHNNMPDPDSWEDYYPSKQKHMPKCHYPKKRPQSMPFSKGMYGEFDWWAHDFPDEETGDYQSVKWVSDQLSKKHDRPFFLACGLYRPHLPWFAPKKYFEMFPLEDIQLPKMLENDWDDLPERAKKLAGGSKRVYHDNVLKHDLHKEAVQAYLAAIAYADAMVGRLLEALDESPHVDNTIVVLWSDHGWQLGEKSHWRKFALWENIAQCNLMFAAPGAAKAGARCDRAVSLMDIYPTLLDLCGLPAKADNSGRSLKPLLANPQTKWDHPAITCLHEVNEYSVSSERWRYIHYRDGGEELYDLKNDPEEWHNLADTPEHAAIKKRLAAHFPESPAAKVATRYDEVYGKKKR